MKYIYFFFSIITIISSCKNSPSVTGVNLIELKNNSNNKLNYLIGVKNSGIEYADTILPISKSNLSTLTGNTFVGNNKSWTDRINELEQDTLSIYFFDPLTVENKGWDKVREDYLILKRYDLSIQDIIDLKYSIKYPPTSEMNKIRMYPPFN